MAEPSAGVGKTLPKRATAPEEPNAAVQLYVLYGLWFVQRWAWFAGLALFDICAFLALRRIFLVNDAVAVAEFFLDAVVVASLLSKKPVYAPRVRVDLTPR